MILKDKPLKQWTNDCRDEYLDEFIRSEGRGNFTQEHCPSCKQAGSSNTFLGIFDPEPELGIPTMRCKDCFGSELVCKGCCVRDHLHNPLHMIEVSLCIPLFSYFLCSTELQCWNGSTFKAATLADLGLRVQLGHAPGFHCAHPHPAPQEFTVIHSNGLHHVNIDYCQCDNVGSAGTHPQQLLRRGWFPATHIEPQTCAMFAVLSLFHMLNLQGKIAGYDFYSGLEKLTDNTGIGKIKVSIWLSHMSSFANSMCVGSLQCIYAHGMGMASPQDAQASWSGTLPVRSQGYSAWRISVNSPSMPPSRHQPTKRLEGSTLRRTVHIIIYFRGVNGD